MTVINPWGTAPQPLDGPFANAFQVPLHLLKAGTDVELPYVSSRLYVAGQGFLTLKFLGGAPGYEDGPEVLMLLDGSIGEYPFRVTKLISSYVPESTQIVDTSGNPLADPAAYIQRDMAFGLIIAVW